MAALCISPTTGLFQFKFIGKSTDTQPKPEARTISENSIGIVLLTKGLAFGQQLSNGRVKPSQIINNQEFYLQRVTLGLQVSTTKKWRAFDPNMQVPTIFSLPEGSRKLSKDIPSHLLYYTRHKLNRSGDKEKLLQLSNADLRLLKHFFSSSL